MKKINQKLIIITAFLFLFLFLIQPVMAGEDITIIYFYSSGCGSCKKYTAIVDKIAQNYSEEVVVIKKDVKYKENSSEMNDYGFTSFPCAVINNETKIPRNNLTYETLEKCIESYIAGIKPNETFNLNESIDIPFFGRMDISNLSLPAQTIILGALDSFNPCSFFVLLFLMNLLLYAGSRRKMFMIGAIFIFFSGFFYFIFMSALLNVFLLTGSIFIITVVAGVIALCLGAINIKDFFFFKKGVSLSIPEDKKPMLYERVRALVKTSYLPTAIGGTIFLAASVNTYELLCTLGFPLIFTRSLTLNHLSGLGYYTYIFFYNVVYVIPLIIIVLVFVFTLGKIKLSEWHGRILKLVSGIMMVSFGVLFLIDFKILQNVVTPVLLLVFSLLATFVISFVWKRYKDREETT
ncbi:MAG: thioredoxin domain-containing protein [Euryarchaeota archaeon]|nr:thioredoxin domain-containing protein [Euryarchaeota archaeon]